jgi:hypothetical protein
VVHWYRNMFGHVPSTKFREVTAILKTIHASEDIVVAREKAIQVMRSCAPHGSSSWQQRSETLT